MGVSTVPHTFLVNGDGKIVWEHKGYMKVMKMNFTNKQNILSNNKDEECNYFNTINPFYKDLSFSRL